MEKTNQDIAVAIETFIPIGRQNAISRKTLSSLTGMSDRLVRKHIADSSAPIINLGYGYFIPDERDEIDMAEKNAYVFQERARVRSIVDKLNEKFGEEDLERE